MEAAIPISILAIGLARVYARRSSLLENVIITGIGGVSGARRRGRHLHAARALHPEARPAPGADRLHLPLGRLPRGAVPDPAAALLRARDARPVPLPGGHRDHRGARDGREGRLAGEAAAAGHRDRGRLRLPRHHLPRVARVRGLPVRARDEDARGARAGGGLLRRRGVHPRPRLRDGAALVDDPVLRRLPLELRAGAAHLDDRPRDARGRQRLSRHDPDRDDVGRPDLPRLRPLHRRGRHRHGRHLRDPEVAAHHRRVVLGGRPHLPLGREREPGADRPRPRRRDAARGRRRLDARRGRLLLDARPVAAWWCWSASRSRCCSPSSSPRWPPTRSRSPPGTRSRA